MSREIKFRAWNVQTKELLYDVTIAPDGKVAAFSPLDGRYVRSYSHDEVIPLQFIGVHDDDDGEEIYVGHILLADVEGDKIPCKVERCGPGFLLASNELPDGFLWIADLMESDGDHLWIPGAKIIGNIYEHPHLLEVSHD